MRSTHTGPSSSMKKVRKMIVIVPRTMLTTPFVIETAAPGQPEQPLRAAVVDLLAHLLDDVVLRLEKAEPAPALRHVVDVAGHGVDELVHVVDERRDEQRADCRRRRGARAGAPTDAASPGGRAAPLQHLDERVDREREEERDRDPDDHVSRDRDEVEQRPHRDREPEDREDRAHAEADDALGHRQEHPRRTGRFLYASGIPCPSGAARSSTN